MEFLETHSFLPVRVLFFSLQSLLFPPPPFISLSLRRSRPTDPFPPGNARPGGFPLFSRYRRQNLASDARSRLSPPLETASCPFFFAQISNCSVVATAGRFPQPFVFLWLAERNRRAAWRFAQLSPSSRELNVLGGRAARPCLSRSRASPHALDGDSSGLARLAAVARLLPPSPLRTALENSVSACFLEAHDLPSRQPVWSEISFAQQNNFSPFSRREMTAPT